MNITIHYMVKIYQKSRKFELLSVLTQRDYNIYLHIFSQKFGDNHIKILTQFNFKRDLENFLQEFSETPRKMEHILQTIKAFCTWAEREGYVKETTPKLISKIHRPDLKENSWTEEDVDKIMSIAQKPMQDFIIFAVETGLRQGDLFKLHKNNIILYKGRKFFDVVQSKTKRRVIIPISQKLENYMKNMSIQDYILVSQDGQMWYRNKFFSAWSRLKKRIIKTFGDTQITPHGLRKTACIRLAKAGCSVPEIAAVLGWSLSTVNMMMDKHYFINRISVAENVINRLERDTR